MSDATTATREGYVHGPDIDIFGKRTDLCFACHNSVRKELYDGPLHEYCPKCRHSWCMHPSDSHNPWCKCMERRQ
jgi:formamidopyrimidine-DNA glycosylase